MVNATRLAQVGRLVRAVCVGVQQVCLFAVGLALTPSQTVTTVEDVAPSVLQDKCVSTAHVPPFVGQARPIAVVLV